MTASPNGSFINTSNTSEAPSIKATVRRRISSKAGERPLQSVSEEGGGGGEGGGGEGGGRGEGGGGGRWRQGRWK